MFTSVEERMVAEKLEQLRKVRDGALSPQELAEMITERRMHWLELNIDELLEKYHILRPEEQAYRIIWFEHMHIDPRHAIIRRVSKHKIRVESYNFCPYLEACRRLKLDTRFVCREIGEPSVRAMVARIHPGLRFSRDYDRIRPHNKAYCEEFIELKS